MEFSEQLEKNLKTSAKRNGSDKLLTIGHMANLVALTNRQVLDYEEKTEAELDRVENEFWADEYRYGNSDT